MKERYLMVKKKAADIKSWLGQGFNSLLVGGPVGAYAASVAGSGYEIAASPAQTLTVNIPTEQLFAGAQLMIDALASPYMLIAGIGLGVAILGAILAAIRGLSLR